MGIDLLIYDKDTKILLGIDYFSRKLYGKLLKNKGGDGVLRAIKEIYDKTKFNKLVTDNGKEFANSNLKEWCEQVGIEHKPTIPYYHQGNGRIERANRTIRTALKKAKRISPEVLAEIITNYNNLHHRGIGMTPEEAGIAKNKEKVLEHAKKYGREFKRKDLKEFKVDDLVYVRNETPRSKNDNAFNKKGIVVSKEAIEYEIKVKNDKVIRRHSTQLKMAANRKAVRENFKPRDIGVSESIKI